jgi:zinc transport system substrate-binding protein
MRIVVTMNRRALLALPAALLALTACSAEVAAREGGVVTSLYPLQFVVERIAGEHLTVTNLTAPGQEPHDVDPSIEQTAELADADVLVQLPGLQPALDAYVAADPPALLVDVSRAADLRPADDHDHDGHGEGEGHEHEGEHDPHFWLDPTRMARVAAAVETALAETEPDHADAFAANLEELTAELEALDDEYRRGLAECRTRTVVVSHDAFCYLATYGLELASITGLSPHAEPSPAHLAELRELAEEEGVTTVFTEPLDSPETAETLADELGVTTAVLDPIEGLTDETADGDYFSLMRANLDQLRKANACR